MAANQCCLVQSIAVGRWCQGSSLLPMLMRNCPIEVQLREVSSGSKLWHYHITQHVQVIFIINSSIKQTKLVIEHLHWRVHPMPWHLSCVIEIQWSNNDFHLPNKYSYTCSHGLTTWNRLNLTTWSYQGGLVCQRFTYAWFHRFVTSQSGLPSRRPM